MLIIFYVNFSSDAKNRISDFEFDLYLSRNRFDDMSELIDELNSGFVADESIIEFESCDDTAVIEKAEKTIEDAVYKSSYISSIYIYIPEKNYVISSSHIYVSNSLQSFTDSSWIDMYDEKRQIGFRKYPEHAMTPECISVCCNLSIGNAKEMVVIYNISTKRISDNFNNCLNNGSTFYISSDESNIIFSSDDNAIGKKNNEYLKNISLLNVGENISRYSFIGGNYYAIKMKNAAIRIVIKDINTFVGYLSLNRMLITVLTFIFFVISIFLACVFVIKMYKSFVDMFSAISNNRMGSADGNDINNMMEYVINITNRNQFVENELMQKTVLLQHTKLIALQGQLSPHFLFNTLQRLNVMIWKEFKQDTPSSKIISLMSVLLRDALDTTEFCRSLEKELEYAKKYIEIQKMHYPDRVDFKFNVTEEAKKVLVPKCILQPVIENSLSYAIPNLDKKGEIKIDAFRDEKKLFIIISDNGKGISPENLKKIRENLLDTSLERKKNIGLVNVNQRIKILFGSEYGLKIDSDTNGTTVTITVFAE